MNLFQCMNGRRKILLDKLKLNRQKRELGIILTAFLKQETTARTITVKFTLSLSHNVDIAPAQSCVDRAQEPEPRVKRVSKMYRDTLAVACGV